MCYFKVSSFQAAVVVTVNDTNRWVLHIQVSRLEVLLLKTFENFFRRSLWPTKVWVRLGWRKFRFFVPTWNSQDFIIIILRAVLTSGEKSSMKHFTKSRSKLNLIFQDDLYVCTSIIFCIFSLCFGARLLTVSPILDMTFLQNTTLTNYKEAQIKQQKFVAELQVSIHYHRFVVLKGILEFNKVANEANFSYMFQGIQWPFTKLASNLLHPICRPTLRGNFT